MVLPLIHKSTNILKIGLLDLTKMHVLEEVKCTIIVHLAPYKVLDVLFMQMSTCCSLIGLETQDPVISHVEVTQNFQILENISVLYYRLSESCLTLQSNYIVLSLKTMRWKLKYSKILQLLVKKCTIHGLSVPNNWGIRKLKSHNAQVLTCPIDLSQGEQSFVMLCVSREESVCLKMCLTKIGIGNNFLQVKAMDLINIRETILLLKCLLGHHVSKLFL